MRHRFFASLVIILGIVLSPLRATAATVPLLLAYDATIRPSATTRIEGAGSVRRESRTRQEYGYDAALVGYGGSSSLGAERGAGAVLAYDDEPKLADRHEV